LYQLNATTEFLPKIPESSSKTIRTWKTLHGWSHKLNIPIQMLFLFIDLHSASLSVSERHGYEIKQLSAAIGMARNQSYYLTLAEKSISYGSL